METLDLVHASKLIGAGIAVIPLAGVGVGLGVLFASIIQVMGRNPSVSDTVKGTGLVYFALIEALGLFALGMGLIILYVA